MKAIILDNKQYIYVIHENNGRVYGYFKTIKNILEVGVKAESFLIYIPTQMSYNKAVDKISENNQAVIIGTFNSGSVTLKYIAHYLTQWTIKHYAGWWDGGESNERS